MTEKIIQMNYRRSLEQAKELEEQAARLHRVAGRDLETMLMQLRGAWTGANADQYAVKCRVLQQKIEKTASELEKSAQTLRTAAQRLYNAEMEALRLAQERWGK